MKLLESMTDLRWILLALGLLFIGGLVWFDRHRRRQAGGNDALNVGSPVKDAPAHAEPHIEPPTHNEPRAPSSSRPLPVIDWGALEREAAAEGLEPLLDDSSDASDAATAAIVADGSGQGGRVPGNGDESGHSAAARIDHWPPEEQRRICNLRIVPRPQERFAGRELRRALQACGFVHGVLGIFHRVDAEGRALISAASLSRPGQLDPELMDFQRFNGLHLFAVLPGPLPDGELLQQLFAVGTDLSQRVRGALQDERGAGLDAARMRELMQQYSAPVLMAVPAGMSPTSLSGTTAGGDTDPPAV